MLTTSRRYIGIIGFCFLISVFLFFSYRFYFAHQFKQSYDAYAKLSDIHVTAAFTPATEANPLRQELNRALADVLATELPRAERLARAERGVVLLNELEKQIDAIGDAGEAVSKEIERMEARATGAERKEIVDLALERARIIGDIRGLSYRASYHTADIFKRIIEGNGELTAAHVEDLNNQIPLVEEQFDRRTALYTELESINSSITRSAVGLRVF